MQQTQVKGIYRFRQDAPIKTAMNLHAENILSYENVIINITYKNFMVKYMLLSEPVYTIGTTTLQQGLINPVCDEYNKHSPQTRATNYCQ